MTRASKVPEAPPPVRRTPGKTVGPRARTTVKAILDNARQLFQDKGFIATSVEDITSAAGVSRATFWTYFGSKQDVLRTLGADAEKVGMGLAKEFAQLPPGATLEAITEWVESYLDFLEDYGAFVAAVYQAADADPELRTWSLASELAGAKVIGKGLATLRGNVHPPGVDPTLEGLAILGMLERIWFNWRIDGMATSRKRVARSLAHLIWGTAR